MRIFSKIYVKMMQWAKHPHAVFYLAGISFIESSFFPIPPDVMLAPMALAQPRKAWWYATITMVSSVLGALFGYIIGMFFFELIQPLLVHLGYLHSYTQVQYWFEKWGFWVMFVAAFSPLPFKLFTIAGGALHVSLIPFIVGCIIGRGGRFYLVSALMYWGGERMDNWLRRVVDWLGWLSIIIIIAAYLIYKLI